MWEQIPPVLTKPPQEIIGLLLTIFHCYQKHFVIALFLKVETGNYYKFLLLFLLSHDLSQKLMLKSHTTPKHTHILQLSHTLINCFPQCHSLFFSLFFTRTPIRLCQNRYLRLLNAGQLYIQYYLVCRINKWPQTCNQMEPFWLQ